MYLINLGTLKQFTLLDNSEMNSDLCYSNKLEYETVDVGTLGWMQYHTIHFEITTSDSAEAGLKQMNRVEGTCQEDFKLSMCYLDEPTQITVESGPFVFYVDTTATLTTASETNTIEISPLIMTSISDTDAVQCEFSVVVESNYTESIIYNDPYLEIVVTTDMAVGTYDVTFRLEVASEGWSREYTVQFELQ